MGVLSGVKRGLILILSSWVNWDGLAVPQEADRYTLPRGGKGLWPADESLARRPSRAGQLTESAKSGASCNHSERERAAGLRQR